MATKPHFDADITDIKEKKEEGRIIEYMLGPRAFDIVWGNDPRYWKIPAGKGSDAVTKLIGVSWLEVTGLVQNVEKGKTYGISFKLSMKPADTTWWSGRPVYLMAKVGKNGVYEKKKLTQFDRLSKEPVDIPNPNSGDAFQIDVRDDAIDRRLYFGLYEVWSGKWKQGLRIHGATIKEVKKQQQQQ